MHVTGFAPLLGPEPLILILGSMPGVRALAVQEYYAHPQNAFWTLIGTCIGTPIRHLSYPDRVAQLLQHRIAVWNVLASCWRPGSADARVVLSRSTLNDVPGLLRAHPSVQRVCFNGRFPEQIYRRSGMARAVQERALEYHVLPSSSAAHASRTGSEKAEAWKQALQLPATRRRRA